MLPLTGTALSTLLRPLLGGLHCEHPWDAARWINGAPHPKEFGFLPFRDTLTRPSVTLSPHMAWDLNAPQVYRRSARGCCRMGEVLLACGAVGLWGPNNQSESKPSAVLPLIGTALKHSSLPLPVRPELPCHYRRRLGSGYRRGDRRRERSIGRRALALQPHGFFGAMSLRLS